MEYAALLWLAILGKLLAMTVIPFLVIVGATLLGYKLQERIGPIGMVIGAFGVLFLFVAAVATYLEMHGI